MADRVFELFDDFVSAYARGDRPELDDYLEQAGPQSGELARLVDAWIERAPAPEPREGSVELMRAFLAADPPLVTLRVERRLKVDDVVDGLLKQLALTPTLRAKLRKRYQDLERGRLEPSRVSERVWHALGDLLGPSVKEATRWRPAELRGVRQAFHRKSDPGLKQAAFDMPKAASAMEAKSAGAARERREPDEIDRLFGLV